MIRIPLIKAKTLGFERDMAAFRIESKSANLLPLITKAIVDTGCPFTVISENALRNRRVNYSDTGKVVLIGNIPLQLKNIGICKLTFKDENDNPVSFEQEVYLGIPNIKGYLAQELPSFIGKDFLDNNSLAILNKKTGSFLLTED